MPMATNVHLTAELERFARRCVKSGRYNNVSEVVRAALRLLEETRSAAKLLRECWMKLRLKRTATVVYTIDEVAREMDAIIAKSR